MTVNHGAPVVAHNYSYTALVHQGADGHDQLALGEHCECGVIGLGITGAEPCAPIPCPPMQEFHFDAVIPAHDYVPGTFAAEAAAYYSVDDELAEFKQWAADACELLHDLRGMAEAESHDSGVEAIDDLLRRMENP